MALPSGYKILYDTYEIAGDIRTGMRASLTFEVPWSITFTFLANLIPSPTATTPGSIIWTPPYQLPISLTGRPAVPLYAQSYRCKPKGYNGTPATNAGLSPGDYYSVAFIDVQFETPSAIQQFGDDPQNLNQLDPNNPITACEQSIQMISKIETRPGSAYTYVTTGQPVPGQIGINRPEVRIVCKFPRIPVLPWQLFQPYVGKINSVAILNCVVGSLLLEGTTTVYTPGTDGSIAQNLGLMFAFNPDPTGASLTGSNWNTQPLPDGSGYSLIQGAGGSNPPPYTSADFRQIFNTIQF